MAVTTTKNLFPPKSKSVAIIDNTKIVHDTGKISAINIKRVAISIIFPPNNTAIAEIKSPTHVYIKNIFVNFFILKYPNQYCYSNIHS